MMCIIIDTCTFHAVFDTENKNHSKYKPVLDWIVNRRGKIITGGTKYRKEMSGRNYLRILTEFDRQKRLVKLTDSVVDREEARLKSKVKHKDFDDAHLIAMVIVSKCRVVCTDDDRAIPFLTRPDLYPKRFRRPKIYKTQRNSVLCCQDNIVDVCQPET
jgi:predicted nucleic acid-binding protein